MISFTFCAMVLGSSGNTIWNVETSSENSRIRTWFSSFANPCALATFSYDAYHGFISYIRYFPMTL